MFRSIASRVTPRSIYRASSSSTAAARFFATSSSSSNQAGRLSRLLTTPLSDLDPTIYNIIEHEKQRQRDSLALIPSENFTSIAVLSALGSVMQNKYSEGYPNARYYGGNEYIDQAESLCQQRALAAFRLDPQEWGVNVQPHSGSPANFYVYTAVLGPHERMMALDLPHGGHLSHGYSTPTKKVSAVSIYFEVLPYRLDEKTGIIDYETLTANAKLYRPKLLVTGASAYPRHIDYGKFREIANINQSLLMVDMAHISGMIAAGVLPSPFEHADIVTTTTHKSLRGPRGAMIFYRKGNRYNTNDKQNTTTSSTAANIATTSTSKPATQYDLEDRINSAVFPGHQGGPHNHTIAALAVALLQAATPEFKEYQQQVLLNNAAMVKALLDKKYTLVSGGSDNHLILLDLRPHKINGGKVEKVLESVNIAINKNTVPGDISAMNPGGIRLGSPALTSRGLKEQDFVQVIQFIHRGIEMAINIQKQSGVKMTDFKKHLDSQIGDKNSPLAALRKDVIAFARQFPAVGFDENSMKYKD